MTSPAVAIQLDSIGRVYQPGEKLTGRFRWDVEPCEDVKRVELSVLWYTEGKGDEDFGVHYFEQLAEEESKPSTWRPFKVRLPASPLSYDGQLVKIRWCVRVRVFFRNSKEAVGEKGFRMTPVANANHRVD